MRNLKRFLAVFVSVMVMLTAMVPAFAAETSLTAADVCAQLDMLRGSGDGVTDAYLATQPDRVQAAIMLLRLMGLEDTAIADGADLTENFGDVDGLNATNKAITAYLKANPDLGFVGNAGNFFPTEKITAAQYYKVLLTVLGYEQGVDFEWSGVVDFAAEVGITAGTAAADFTVNDLAEATVEALQLPIKDSDVTLIEAMVEAGFIAEDDAVAVGLMAPAVVPVEATAAATGAKKLTVTFNQAVDTTKAVFAVKKGSITVNVAKVEFAADKASATLELATKLTEGDYTVTVSGLGDALTATTKVENEKVAKIEFATDKAVIDSVYANKVTTSYKVYNQYGEDVTSANTPTFTAGKGTPSVPSAGTLLLTAASDYTVNEVVAVSAIHAASNTFASTVLTVVPKAQVADISIDSLYNSDGNVPTAGDAGSAYKLVVSAKDQYGNDVAWNKIANDIIVTVSNTSVADVAGGAATPAFGTTSIDGTDKVTLALSGTLAEGTSTVTMISKTTGKLARFDVVVKAAATVDVLSLSAPELAVAGEKVNIPFTAVDQFGAAVVKASDLNSGMNSLTTSVGAIAFKQDYVKNVANLELDLTGVTSAQTLFITGVTKTNKVVTLQISVVDPAKPVVINNTKDLTVNAAVGGSITLSENNLVAKDQYGRDITPNFSVYRYAITTSDSGKVSLSAATITVDDGSITLGGVAKGTSTITVEIQKVADGSAVDNSAITFDVKVVEKADIASYEMADFAKLYQASAGTYDVDLAVNGLLADGSKVAVPASYYNVTINDANVSYVSGKVYSTTRSDWGDATTKDIPVIVTVFGANGPVVLTKNVTVCKDAPAIDTIELATSGIATLEGDGVVSATYTAIRANGVSGLVVDAVKAVDQYGKEFVETSSDYAYIAATNLPDGRAANLSDIAQGDTFNVIAITNGGKTITFKVIVK